jgi:hypothetical protein
MLAHSLKSFHRQASKNAKYRNQGKSFDEDVLFSEISLPDKTVESEIKGDFEVQFLLSDG